MYSQHDAFGVFSGMISFVVSPSLAPNAAQVRLKEDDKDEEQAKEKAPSEKGKEKESQKEKEHENEGSLKPHETCLRRCAFAVRSFYIRGMRPRISADIRGIDPGYSSDDIPGQCHGYLRISRGRQQIMKNVRGVICLTELQASSLQTWNI